MSLGTVSATVQDPSGQIFAFGTWQLTFKPTYGTPGLFTDGGVAFTKLYGGTLDATGSFSQVVNRSDTIAPAGSKWTLTVSPNANSQSFSVDLNVNSGAFSATALINAAITNILIPATPLAHAYKDNEVIPVPNSGSLYFNTVSKNVKAWDITTSGWITLANASAPSVPLYSRDCRVDGILDTTGAADSSAVINTCIANALAAKQSIVILPAGNFLINTCLNLTNRPGMRLTGAGWQAGVTSPPVGGVGITNLWCNTNQTGLTSGAPCIDTTGSGAIEIDHMVLTMCCGASMGGASQFSLQGILMGRDNAGGGGAANPFCFQENYNIHDIYITNNGSGTSTQNGNRGQIGIYNVSAENGLYSNIQILANTPMLFSQNDVVGSGSVYQTLQTGCPLSMTGVTMVNPVLTGSTTTLPLIEANTTNAFSLHGFQCVGGNACIKFENTQGASPTAGWTVSGLTEQSSSDILATSVGLNNMRFFLLIANPPPGVVFKPLASNLTFNQNLFVIDDYFSLVPFIDNVQTGTVIAGSIINIGAATAASNTTLNNCDIIAPTVTDANITFNAASIYDYKGSSGYITHGIVKATEFLATNNGTLAAPALGITSSATGWFLNSNTAWQLTYGGTANCGYNGNGISCGSGQGLAFSSALDMNNAAVDSSISRIGVGIVGIGNGTPGTFSGSTQLKRARYIGGTAYTSADAAIVLSTGWGTTRTVSAGTGFDEAFSFSVNATGTGQAANPTITITFKDGTWTNAPQVVVLRNDIVTPFNTPPHTIAVTATTLTITFNGTPTAANVYSYIVVCKGV